MKRWRQPPFSGEGAQKDEPYSHPFFLIFLEDNWKSLIFIRLSRVIFRYTFQIPFVCFYNRKHWSHDISTAYNSEDSMADIRRLLQTPKPSEDPDFGWSKHTRRLWLLEIASPSKLMTSPLQVLCLKTEWQVDSTWNCHHYKQRFASSSWVNFLRSIQNTHSDHITLQITPTTVNNLSCA